MNFSGNILGTSATMAVANTTLQTIHFDFASMVALVPGVEVVAEIIFDQDWIIEGGFGDPYAGGAFYDINGTVVIADIDLVFTEGLHAARVPEPATLALLGLGLAGPGFSRRKQ